MLHLRSALAARQAAQTHLRRRQQHARQFTTHLPQRLRLLVVECYDRAGRERISSVGCRKASDIFASLLHKLAPAGYAVDLDFVHPAESSSHVLDVSELEKYNGVVWTGSSLTVTDDVPEVCCVTILFVCLQQRGKVCIMPFSVFVVRVSVVARVVLSSSACVLVYRPCNSPQNNALPPPPRRPFHSSHD